MNEILVSAYRAWAAGSELRTRRRRMKDYTYGRQWGDTVITPEGTRMTEGEYVSQSGKTPLTNNLIRQLVKSVVGRFRNDLPTLGSASTVDAGIARRNSLDELDSRMLEEFLISGCAIQRVAVEKRIYGDGVWVDNVAPDRFFVNRFTDPRSIDIELVGQLHDMSMRELIMRFGHGDENRQRRLEALCTGGGEAAGPTLPLGLAGDDGFFRPTDPARCRVIEVWTLESRNIIKCHDRMTAEMFQVGADSREAVERINRRRRRKGEPAIDMRGSVTARWHCRWFTPSGDVIAEYDSPFAHGLHPYAVKFYPMTDGEVHSFVEDIVDQQRYINRLITLVDHIMSFSAKGVLLLPVESVPPEVGIEDKCREWSRPNGVLPYRARGGCEPKQIVAGSGNAGASELLSLEMKMMERISGVSTALQGHTPDSNVSASAYDNAIKNATIALLDIFNSFVSFREVRNDLINRA